MNGSLGGSLPAASSELAHSWDRLYLFLFGVCIFFFAIVVVSMVVFAIRYRARPGHHAEHITHNNKLEFIWTAIPTLLVMFIFAWGWMVFSQIYNQAPAGAMEVKVVGQQWAWTFQYEDGRTLTNQLVVPKGKPVKLLLTSKINDVVHSFYIPNLRIKRDAVPGMYTSVWFNADTVGQHQIYCTEYCGTNHSKMLATLVVLDEEQWKLWQWGAKVKLPPFVGPGGMTADAASVNEKSAETVPLAVQGKILTEVKGCVACHSADGSIRIGPTYKGIFESEVTLTDGTKVKVDENYIRESILKPQAKIVKGFEGIMMPTYAGQLDESELNAVIEYIKSVKNQDPK
jgi:cytochrome c oxidase subunit II